MRHDINEWNGVRVLDPCHQCSCTDDWLKWCRELRESRLLQSLLKEIVANHIDKETDPEVFVLYRWAAASYFFYLSGPLDTAHFAPLPSSAPLISLFILARRLTPTSFSFNAPRSTVYLHSFIFPSCATVGGDATPLNGVPAVYLNGYWVAGACRLYNHFVCALSLDAFTLNAQPKLTQSTSRAAARRLYRKWDMTFGGGGGEALEIEICDGA